MQVEDGLETWLRKTIERGGQKLSDMKFPIQLALNTPGTWNHTKIIAADDKRVITGGHNLWAADYLAKAPVHDVSGLFEGPAAKAARRFCDKLWVKPANKTLLLNGKFTHANPPARVVNKSSPAVGQGCWKPCEGIYY
jgi:phosphatidylserine/phosphatidylglycerophosphate/cardiolipin synthase-like enzyme